MQDYVKMHLGAVLSNYLIMLQELQFVHKVRYCNDSN